MEEGQAAAGPVPLNTERMEPPPTALLQDSASKRNMRRLPTKKSNQVLLFPTIVTLVLQGIFEISNSSHCVSLCHAHALPSAQCVPGLCAGSLPCCGTDRAGPGRCGPGDRHPSLQRLRMTGSPALEGAPTWCHWQERTLLAHKDSSWKRGSGWSLGSALSFGVE